MIPLEGVSATLKAENWLFHASVLRRAAQDDEIACLNRGSVPVALPSEQDVRAVLMRVDDPELGVNIVDLGLVYGVEVSVSGIFVKLTMTTPACPLHEYLTRACDEAIRGRFPDVNSVHVELVWEPPWDPSRMSQTARKQLGWSG